MSYLSGKGPKREEGECSVEAKNEVLSPLPFLVGLSKDRVDIVHSALLSQMPPQAKNEVIHTVLMENKELDDKYWNWRNEAAKAVSQEIIALLPPDDAEQVAILGRDRRYQEAIGICYRTSADAGCRMSEWVEKAVSTSRWSEIAFETAEKTLKQWIAQKGEYSRQESKKSTADTQQINGNVFYLGDDNGYSLVSTELENVSALCLEPTKSSSEERNHHHVINIDNSLHQSQCGDSSSGTPLTIPEDQMSFSETQLHQQTNISSLPPPGLAPTNAYGYGINSPAQPLWNQFGNQPQVHVSPRMQEFQYANPGIALSVEQKIPTQTSIYPQLTENHNVSLPEEEFQGPMSLDAEGTKKTAQGAWKSMYATDYAEKYRNRLEHHKPSIEATPTPAASQRTTIRSMTRSKETSADQPARPTAKARSVSRPKPSVTSRTRSSSRPRIQNSHKQRSKALNVLLLGETGVGKTTFINGLANYLKFATLDSSLQGESTILVDASFTMTYKNNRTTKIHAKANSGDDYRNMKNNERLSVCGTSSTQEPVDHLFQWCDEGQEKLIRIIDTPGINDTRGTDQDVKNFDKILNHIADLGELHAICIVMKPNESKFTVGFRYCLDELLVKLHRSATKNILFCFTNTRSTLYRPGDTLSTLHEYLKKIAKETGVILKADRTNIFCYDNDCFRYLCVLRQLPGARTESSMVTFSEGWLHNVKECAKMLQRIQGLSAHVVEDTVTINHTRRVITALARPLAEVARNHVVNMKLVQDHIDEIENLKNTGRALDRRVYHEQVVMIPVKLPFPRTVCTSAQCVEYKKINELEIQAVPKAVCHDDCHLKGVRVESVKNPDLSECSAFRVNGSCRVCGCSFEKHMHITFDFQHQKEMVMDKESMRKLESCTDRKKAVEIILKEQKEKLRQLEKEHEDIRESCAEFSAFLSSNSMKHACDPYADYLQHLIQDEENKYEHGGGSGDVMIALMDMVEDYTKRVKYIMDEIKAGRRHPLTTPQLNNLIDSLSRLKLCGPTIEQLKELHLRHAPKTEVLVAQQATPSDLIQEAINKNGLELSAEIGLAMKPTSNYTSREFRRHF